MSCGISRIAQSVTAWPMCRKEAVTSTPYLMRSGLPEASRRKLKNICHTAKNIAILG
jgi:hypothetical protein